MGTFYFQRDENLAQKPEVLRIRRQTGLSAADVVFHIEEFWRHVNQLGHSLNDGTEAGVLPGYELADLPLLVGLTDEYWGAVVDAGWIIVGDVGQLIIPGFDGRFGRLAQKRIAATVRKQKSRAAFGDDVTPSPPRSLPSSQLAPQPSPLPSPQLSPQPSPRSSPSRSSDRAQQPTRQSSDNRSQGRVTTVAATIDPPRVAGRRPGSQFDLLTVADLANCGKLLCWLADISVMPRPVALNDPWHQVRVIAAGLRATSGKNVKEPLALFKSIVGKRRWTMLEAEDLREAELRFATYQHGRQSLQVQYQERAGPNDDAQTTSAVRLVGDGFGALPETSRPTGAVELLKWQQRRVGRAG